ncbi:basic proline-rich protein-like [Vombatus ursinus]|uniref:basic proline-rich protein-like n=1 Tax=Vombatus ursinus TaxID=29139 RepID=UPI000FFDA191|nr:basic proline-rich protein-like [Vombatus ursinus]
MSRSSWKGRTTGTDSRQLWARPRAKCWGHRQGPRPMSREKSGSPGREGAAAADRHPHGSHGRWDCDGALSPKAAREARRGPGARKEPPGPAPSFPSSPRGAGDAHPSVPQPGAPRDPPPPPPGPRGAAPPPPEARGPAQRGCGPRLLCPAAPEGGRWPGVPGGGPEGPGAGRAPPPRPSPLPPGARGTLGGQAWRQGDPSSDPASDTD